MAEISKDERSGVDLAGDAIANAQTPQVAVAHAFDGLAKILLDILYELRVANERAGADPGDGA